ESRKAALETLLAKANAGEGVGRYSAHGAAGGGGPPPRASGAGPRGPRAEERGGGGCALLRARGGRWGRLPPSRLWARPRGRGVEAARRPVLVRPRHDLAQGQVSPAARGGDR